MNDKEITEHINAIQIILSDMALELKTMRLELKIQIDDLHATKAKVNACMTRINELGCYEA